MKLVLFINSLVGGGAERVLVKLANHWSDDGHDVLLVTLDAATAGLELRPQVRHLSLDASGAAPTSVHALINNLARAVRLRRVLRAEQPRCVVAFMSSANVLALVAALGTSIPVIASERTHPPLAQVPTLRRVAQRLLYRRAATVVALTRASADWLREHLACRVTVIPNAVAMPLAHSGDGVPPAQLVDEGLLVVLCVGRLVPDKQMRQALVAFARADLGSNWRLVVIGRGDQLAALEHSAAELELGDRWLHLDEARNIQQWYERADIYLSASRREGFPNALLEAMACGCPAVAYDCPTGPAELIEDGKSGFLVPLDDAAALAERLRRLALDPELRARQGAAARSVGDKFSDARIFALWTRTLESATA